MRRTSGGNYYDAMQVCLNGHLITERYHESPEFRKKFCTTCGEPTIFQCPECKAEIQGYYHTPGVVYIGLSRTSVPHICHDCGKDYPWKKKQIEDFEKKNLIDKVEVPNISQEKKNLWKKRIAAAEAYEVIKELMDEPTIISNDKLHSGVINLSSRWHLVEGMKRKGVESLDRLLIEINKLNDDLLALIKNV